ncbi:MAG: MlaD family protein [Brevinematales bacterium]|nr:MlaD family protein [Brevinematales bacterium]
MYKFSFIEKLVGVTIILVLFLLFVLILFLGRANEWFRPYVRYYTILNNVQDVSPGKKIYYKGIVIGKVAEVSIQPDDTFRVDFYIYSEYTNKIKTDTLFIIRSEILGSKRFEIIPGSESTETLKDGEMVYSTDVYEGKVLAKLKGVYSVDEDINKIINDISLISSLLLDYVDKDGEIPRILNSINRVLDNLNIVLARLNSSTLPSVDSVLAKELPSLMKETTSLMDTLNEILKDENVKQTLSNVNRITYDISKVTEDLKNNRGDISNLVRNLEALSRNLNDIILVLKGNK